jgi:hypothetical protein
VVQTAAVALGPQQMPPQGAKALVGQLLGGRRRGAEVAATLDESQPGETTLEFINEGTDTAGDLRCLYRDAAGDLVRGSLGNLAPGATASCSVDVAAGEPFRCVWICDGRRGGARLWSYDGRRKRLRPRGSGSEDAFFDAVYG